MPTIGDNVKVTRVWEGEVTAVWPGKFEVTSDGLRYVFADEDLDNTKGFITTLERTSKVFKSGDVVRAVRLHHTYSNPLRADAIFSLGDEGYMIDGKFVKWDTTEAFSRHTFNDKFVEKIN